MKQPVLLVPDAMKAMHALHTAAEKTGAPAKILGLIELRVSQINGCGVCVDMHALAMKKAGETDQRLFGLAAWRDTPYFTDAERAALALAEALTRIADRPDAVTDEIWEDARKHFDEQALAGILLSIAGINVWNRLNVATRQLAGTAWR